jgi:hypothetical protein
MAQFSIVPFHRIGLALIGHREVNACVVGQFSVSRQLVAVVPISWGKFIQCQLQHFITHKKGDMPSQNAAGRSVYKGDDEGFLFLYSMKVCSSSISMVSTSSGIGAGGSWAAWAFTQLATLWWLTPRCRAIRLRFMPSTYNCTARRRISSLYPTCFGSGV